MKSLKLVDCVAQKIHVDDGSSIFCWRPCLLARSSSRLVQFAETDATFTFVGPSMSGALTCTFISCKMCFLVFCVSIAQTTILILDFTNLYQFIQCCGAGLQFIYRIFIITLYQALGRTRFSLRLDWIKDIVVRRHI